METQSPVWHLWRSCELAPQTPSVSRGQHSPCSPGKLHTDGSCRTMDFSNPSRCSRWIRLVQCVGESQGIGDGKADQTGTHLRTYSWNTIYNISCDQLLRSELPNIHVLSNLIYVLLSTYHYLSLLISTYQCWLFIPFATFCANLVVAREVDAQDAHRSDLAKLNPRTCQEDLDISKRSFNHAKGITRGFRFKGITANLSWYVPHSHQRSNFSAAEVPKLCRWIAAGDSAIAPKTLKRQVLSWKTFGHNVNVKMLPKQDIEKMIPCWSMLINVDQCWSSVWTWYLHCKPLSRQGAAVLLR